jgi:hypothetical protein
MFTNRSVYLLLVVALMIVTACTPTSSHVVPSPSAEAPTMAQTTTSVKPVPHMPLPPGTYISEVFDTPLTYTVPDGWKMFEDEPGQFGLALLENDGPCLCIWRDVRAAAKSCAEEPEPSVGSSASDIAGWLSMHEGLITTDPEPVSVGGLHGYMIDVRMDPDWTNDCPFSNGEPIVMTLVGTDISAGVHWGTDKSSAQRYYLLDLGEDGADGNIAITVEVCCGAQWDERMAVVTPVIESFVFDAK